MGVKEDRLKIIAELTEKVLCGSLRSDEPELITAGVISLLLASMVAMPTGAPGDADDISDRIDNLFPDIKNSVITFSEMLHRAAETLKPPNNITPFNIPKAEC